MVSTGALLEQPCLEARYGRMGNSIFREELKDMFNDAVPHIQLLKITKEINV